jgi:hypothetical protein
MYFASAFFDVARERGRGLAGGRQVFDERRRDLAVRTHRHCHRHFRIAPDDDVDGLARPNQVLGFGHLRLDRRVLAASRATAQRQYACGSQHERRVFHQVRLVLAHVRSLSSRPLLQPLVRCPKNRCY